MIGYKQNDNLKYWNSRNTDEYLTILEMNTFPINRPHNCLTITPKH